LLCANVLQVDQQVARRQYSKPSIGPLDDTNSVTIEILLESEVGDFPDIAKTIEIDVI
jgi:hypothetical protein